jgi:hypothetical protein
LLGLTPREAEELFWVAQGKTNAEIGLILAELGVVRRAAELRRVAHLYGASETADTLQRPRKPTLFKRVVRRLRAAKRTIVRPISIETGILS